jgi:hypothetical protein
MSYAITDRAPLNASAWRVRWRLHVVAAGLQSTAASCVGERIRHIQRPWLLSGLLGLAFRRRTMSHLLARRTQSNTGIVCTFIAALSRPNGRV